MRKFMSCLMSFGLCAAFSIGFGDQASAQKTKAVLKTEINTTMADNTSGAITPLILRNAFLDVIDSYLDYNGGSSFTCTTHQWVSSASGLSAFTCSQPAFSDISGIAILSQGGTGANLTASNGGIVYSNATTFALLAGTVTAGQCLLSGSTAAPTWGSCAGAAAVSSVSNSDSSLTISPTTGSVVASINYAHAGTWTGPQIFNPASGDAITIGPAANSLSQSVTSTQSSPIGGSSAGPIVYNQFNINNQTGVTGAGATNGLLDASIRGFSVAVTDGNNVAGTNTIGGLFQILNTIGATSTDRISLATNAYSTKANTGFLLGLDAIAQLGSGATQTVLVPIQAESSIGSGATATNRIGIEVSNIGPSQASTFDSAIVIDSEMSGGQYKNGITFGSPSLAQVPLDTAGNIFRANQSMTVANVFSMNNVTVTGNILDFPFAGLTGNGQLNLGAAGTHAGIVDLSGATQGTLKIQVAPNVNANSTITLPNGTTDFSSTSGIVQQATSGSAFTVGTISTNSNFPLGAGVAAGFLAGTTDYAGFGSICNSTSESSCLVPVSSPATMKNFYAVAPNAAGGGQSYTFTVRRNLGSTTITCAISGASATSCNDTTHTQAYSAGDTIDVQMVASGGASSAFGLTFMLTSVTTSP